MSTTVHPKKPLWGFLLTQYQHIDSDVPYSEVPNQNTGTMEKIPPKLLAMCTFLAVLLAINQEFKLLY